MQKMGEELHCFALELVQRPAVVSPAVGGWARLDWDQEGPVQARIVPRCQDMRIICSLLQPVAGPQHVNSRCSLHARSRDAPWNLGLWEQWIQLRHPPKRYPLRDQLREKWKNRQPGGKQKRDGNPLAPACPATTTHPPCFPPWSLVCLPAWAHPQLATAGPTRRCRDPASRARTRRSHPQHDWLPSTTTNVEITNNPLVILPG